MLATHVVEVEVVAVGCGGRQSAVQIRPVVDAGVEPELRDQQLGFASPVRAADDPSGAEQLGLSAWDTLRRSRR